MVHAHILPAGCKQWLLKKGYYTIWFFVSLTSRYHFLLPIPCPLIFPNRRKHTYFKLAICNSESKIWKALCAHI